MDAGNHQIDGGEKQMQQGVCFRLRGKREWIHAKSSLGPS